MDDPREVRMDLYPVHDIDPACLDRDPYHDVPDLVVAIHEGFVGSMPFLESEARLAAAKYFDKLSDPAAGTEVTEDPFPQDDPAVLHRFLEFYYGQDKLSIQEAFLRTLRESEAYGPEQADWFEEQYAEQLEVMADPFDIPDEFYEEELRGLLHQAFGTYALPDRADEPTPPADYAPRTRRFYKADERPLTIRGVEIIKSDDIHKLEIPEFKQIWIEPTDQVISALDAGKHVLLDSRRNSGKTHIFPAVLRERAPASWTISEMTNNNLRGGENFMGLDTSIILFNAILQGKSIGEAIAEEQRMHGHTPHVRHAETGTPERTVLVVDEVQHAILEPEMYKAGVMNKLLAWADASGVQLVLIGAIGDRRQIAEAQNRINAVFQQQQQQQQQHVNINGLFERPEYPTEDLRHMLRHTGVSPTVMDWWLHDPVAAPLRTMRGVYVTYSTLLQPRNYEVFNNLQLQSVEEIGKLLTDVNLRNDLAHTISRGRLIDELAAVCSGSGEQMKTLAEYFGALEPNYRYLGYDEGVTAEDII